MARPTLFGEGVKTEKVNWVMESHVRSALVESAIRNERHPSQELAYILKQYYKLK